MIMIAIRFYVLFRKELFSKQKGYLDEEIVSSKIISAYGTPVKGKKSFIAKLEQAYDVLKANNIVAEGLRYKSNGKAIVTNKAKQIQKIHCSFKLAENKVLDKGPVDIYIRMLGPDGIVMSQTGDFKTTAGESLGYTVIQTVDFDGSDTNVDAVVVKGLQFAKGIYNVELYHSGQKIGAAPLDIK